MSEATKCGGRSYGNSKIVHEAALKLSIACGGTIEEIEDKVSAESLGQEFRNSLPKAYILKSAYDEMSEEQIKSIEADNSYVLVPVKQEELVEQLNKAQTTYTLSKPPEIPILEPCVRAGRMGSGKSTKIKPKDYVKKRKKKQRIQKQSRKKHK